MTGGCVLDTDMCIHALRGHGGVLRELKARSPSAVFTTAMTLAELRYGCLKSRDPEANLARVTAFLGPLTILDFDAAAAAAHAEIRWALREQPIGERDLVIASVARARSLSVVTANAREFSRVPGLSLETWGSR